MTMKHFDQVYGGLLMHAAFCVILEMCELWVFFDSTYIQLETE